MALILTTQQVTPCSSCVVKHEGNSTVLFHGLLIYQWVSHTWFVCEQNSCVLLAQSENTSFTSRNNFFIHTSPAPSTNEQLYKS